MSSYSSYLKGLQLLPSRLGSLNTLIRATKAPNLFLYCPFSLIALPVASNSMPISTICNSLIMLSLASNSGFAPSLESNSTPSTALSSITLPLSSLHILLLFASRNWRHRQSDSKNVKMTKPITATISVAAKTPRSDASLGKEQAEQ